MLTRNCLSLLLWVLFDGGLLTPLQPQPQQTLEAEPRENVVTMPGRRSSAQRVKRGWVWNQFFVLEEYMGSEPQYVGKVIVFYLSINITTKVTRQIISTINTRVCPYCLPHMNQPDSSCAVSSVFGGLQII